MLAFSMMVPPRVRANLLGRPLDAAEVISKLGIPVLVTHGDRDRNTKPGLRAVHREDDPGRKALGEGIGHAPFYEDAARFNAELATLVRHANRTN